MTGFVVRQPEFGRRLRALRVRRGISQRDLAAGVVNPSYISLLESGNRVPTLDVAIELAAALDVPLASLLGFQLPSPREDRLQADDLAWQVLSLSSVDYGDVEGAKRQITEAYTEAIASGRSDRVLQTGLALHQVLGRAGEHQSQLELAEQLLQRASALSIRAIETKLQIDCAIAARGLGRFAEARRHIDAALATIGKDLVGTIEHVRLLAVQVSIMCDTGDVDRVEERLDTMFEIARELQSRAVLGRAHWVAATAYARLGERARAREHLDRASASLGDPATSVRDWSHFCRAAASIIIDIGHRVEDARRYLDCARAAVELMGDPQQSAALSAVEARFELAAGRPERTVELALPLLETGAGGLSRYDQIRLRMALAGALERLGRRDEAINHMRRAAEGCEAPSLYRLGTQIWRELDRMRSA